MTPQTNNNTENTKTENKKQTKRSRRHWYDHEKIAIIQKFDRGELFPVPGSPSVVQDPKTGLKLRIVAINGWRDQFRGLGLIKGQLREGRAAMQAVYVEPNKRKPVVKTVEDELEEEVMSAKDISMEHLLAQTLLENEKLKRIVEKYTDKGLRTIRVPVKEDRA